MARHDEVWDPGLQPERTRLAWQRTSLALLTASLVVARIVGHHALIPGVVVAAGACVLAGLIGVLSTKRYDRAQVRLQAERPLPGGVVNLLMTGSLLLIGVGAFSFLALTAR